MVIKLFGQKYGEDIAEQIFLDNLQAVADEYRKGRIEQKQEIHTEPYLDFALNKPEIKMFRYKRKRRTVKISFKNLRKGQKPGMIIRVSGGNNDVNTSMGMIRGEQQLEPVLPMHPLIISNAFSVWTYKRVEITYWTLSGLA